MKIEKSGQDYGDRIQLDSARRAAEARSRDDSSSAQRAGTRDEATVSERARALANARSTFDATSTGNSDRVNALHDQVANGQYQVPYAALVSHLVNQMKQS